jgi:hypothetical protein
MIDTAHAAHAQAHKQNAFAAPLSGFLSFFVAARVQRGDLAPSGAGIARSPL